MGVVRAKTLGVLVFVLLAHAFLLVALASVKSVPLKTPKKVEPLKIRFVQPPKPKPKPVVAPKPVVVAKPKPVVAPKPKPKPKPVVKPKPKQTPKPKPKSAPRPKPTPKSVAQQKSIAPVSNEPSVEKSIPFIEEIPESERSSVTEGTESGSSSSIVESSSLGPVQPLAGNVDARFSSRGALDYPERDLRRGLEGTVYVYFTIGLDGKAKKIDRVEGARSGSMKRAAIAFIKSSRFAVQKVNGTPVEQPARAPVVFKIN